MTDADLKTFDGVICFGGEDWWYHNRGHYDMQMMRELSRRLPVLYVNSIGMRMPAPGEGRMFLHRVRRKLRSLRRGFVQVRERFAVMSPLVVPGRAGMAMTDRLLPRQIRRAARRMGISRPLVWLACPPGIRAVDALDPVAVVYQRTDRYESFRSVDPDLVRAWDRRAKERADVTVFCSTLLFEQERGQCRQAHFADHGVDYERFARAGATPDEEPSDVRGLGRPRVGFVGGIDAHTFWPELFVEVAGRLPDFVFVLVGACSLPDGWCDLSNVHLLGQRPYEEVAAYMAACDVLIMPWNRSEWIQACNPVKMKEYLAVGRPVVSTPFRELDRYEGLIIHANDAEEFTTAVREAAANPPSPVQLRERVRAETWAAKAESVLQCLAGRGFRSPEGVAGEPLRGTL